jgi:hypothetical protein
MKTIATILISFFSLTTVNAGIATATLNNNNVEIKFTADNNSRLEIERSFYNNNFTVIASVNVPFATNMMVNDNAAVLAGKAIAYYRVKTIAANGTVSYSNTMVVSLNGTDAASVKNNNTISFTAAQNGNAVITLKSLTGNTASVKTATIAKGANTVELNNLAKGIYTAFISVNGVTVDTQKVIAE